MTDFSRLARKITWVLFANQSLASAGFIAAATINSILGAQLGGSDYWTGVPTAVYLLGSAFAASVWGILMDRIGRRNSMVWGLLIGVIGNLLALSAISTSSLITFLAGMVLMGITNAVVVLGRFAAAEVNPPEKRGESISQVVWGGTFGAVVGPLLVGPMGSSSRVRRLRGRAGTGRVAMRFLGWIVLLAAPVLAQEKGGAPGDATDLARLFPADTFAYVEIDASAPDACLPEWADREDRRGPGAEDALRPGLRELGIDPEKPVEALLNRMPVKEVLDGRAAVGVRGMSLVVHDAQGRDWKFRFSSETPVGARDVYRMIGMSLALDGPAGAKVTFDMDVDFLAVGRPGPIGKQMIEQALANMGGEITREAVKVAGLEIKRGRDRGMPPRSLTLPLIPTDFAPRRMGCESSSG